MPNMYNQYMPYGWTGMPMGGPGGYGMPMPYGQGGVGPDGIFHPGFGGQLDQGHQENGNGFAAGSWEQGGGLGHDGTADTADRKEGRRSKKKGVPPFLSERGGEAQAEEKTVAATASAGNHEQRAQTKGGGDQSSGMEWRQQW